MTTPPEPPKAASSSLSGLGLGLGLGAINESASFPPLKTRRGTLSTTSVLVVVVVVVVVVVSVRTRLTMRTSGSSPLATRSMSPIEGQCVNSVQCSAAAARSGHGRGQDGRQR